ncbi:MAG: metallophosphoesterase [Thermoplasmata archaeon]|jgi:hypothetical protein
MMLDRPVPTPLEILALDPEGADRLLDDLERSVSVHPPFVALAPGTLDEAIVFGDSHGDWRSTLAAIDRFLSGSQPRFLIGLGDYVDRSPRDSPNGSVANALYLLSLAARFPDRVILLQGNHETSRRVPVVPHTLPEEVDDLWGPEEERYQRIVALLERGPLAASTPSGAYLAHAGFPRRLTSPRWTASFDRLDDEGLCEVVWAECEASRNRRGAARPWGARDLDGFLATAGLKILLRGHDADVCGIPLYAGRCLTLHTTRIYERYGGVIVARVPLRSPLRTVADLTIEHLPTEGQSFPISE